MDLVYKAQMLTPGGRSSTIQSADGSVRLKLAVPAAMGGKGDGLNPEQLFAAAFAACFEHSARHIAKTRPQRQLNWRVSARPSSALRLSNRQR